ncbi:DegV family protein [Paenibacillus phoenicis]|jgi:DegV family protein with EDD domain|uniref:DegV family protein n=1 Tax=Paenibacillus phoenicis TaxID=554117 RepID=A0ABU5PGD1_9BACL|nr:MULTISPECIES: DegV family protein [Paenibacillus]EES70999.1 EDD domain protein, DegV family [Paenibacillus sp. oral taxon 786 str. D14]MCT2196665.1 DegV family protein [Paenibacillus sp. p3-SID1389]MEA3568834.1 DegV family protein [Paenibacillus phoenicis]MEC2342768.1 DegV family protein [Paenibacillus barengoltzii]SMF30486.1 EDD domain protein, DegV family [Paenibacillus barengoltzii]
MGSIKIFADSTCDLPAEWIAQYDIGIVPLYVTFSEQTYKDGIDLTVPELYRKVDETGKLPKTAAPSPADFIEAFRPHIEEGRRILYISLSSELSSTYQNALIAADEFAEGMVTVFDSLNLSTGIGLQVMKAVNAAAEGKSVEEIVALLTAVRPQVETEFVIDSLDYLYKGGRCSGMQNIVGSLLKIRPVIKVENGKMTPAYKIRGSREKALDQLLNNALSHLSEMDKDLIFVTHSLADEDAKVLKEALEAKTNARQVAVSNAGCVISSHCGAKTIGILYTKKLA